MFLARKCASVKWQVLSEGIDAVTTASAAFSTLAADAPDADVHPGSASAELIRIRLADAWGEMGAAWGVAPAIARVQAYLLTRQAPLTER